LECAAAIDVLCAKGRKSKEEVVEGKEILVEIVSMLVGLIRANSKEREY